MWIYIYISSYASKYSKAVLEPNLTRLILAPQLSAKRHPTPNFIKIGRTVVLPILGDGQTDRGMNGRGSHMTRSVLYHKSLAP